MDKGIQRCASVSLFWNQLLYLDRREMLHVAIEPHPDEIRVLELTFREENLSPGPFGHAVAEQSTESSLSPFLEPVRPQGPHVRINRLAQESVFDAAQTPKEWYGIAIVTSCCLTQANCFHALSNVEVTGTLRQVAARYTISNGAVRLLAATYLRRPAS
ncbi:MAG: hypothetical protein WA924_15405 [Burkholderiaceae bacterium]